MRIVDNSLEGTGINHYAKALSYYLEIQYDNIYDPKHYYISGVINKVKKHIGKPISDTAIFSNFTAVNRRYKKEYLVVHDTFLWDYGKWYERLFFLFMNIFENMDKVFVSNHTKGKYGEGYVIYPFLYEGFYNVKPYPRDNYFLIDSGSYPNKNIPEYIQVIKANHDINFKKLGGYIGDYENVKYYYNLPYSALPIVYSSSRVLLYLTRDEGFGYPLAQAMITRTPVIMKDIEINREIYESAKYYDNEIIDSNKKINREILEDMVQDKDFLEKKEKRIRDLVDPEKLKSHWWSVLK